MINHVDPSTPLTLTHYGWSMSLNSYTNVGIKSSSCIYMPQI